MTEPLAGSAAVGRMEHAEGPGGAGAGDDLGGGVAVEVPQQHRLVSAAGGEAGAQGDQILMVFPGIRLKMFLLVILT